MLTVARNRRSFEKITTTFDFISVEDVYAKDDKVLENMW